MENLHDWINSAVLIIMGALFLFQNSIVLKMKSFMDIFDINKVKEYNDMREETIKQKSISFFKDNESVKKLITDVSNKNINIAKDIYFKQMGEEHNELIYFSMEVLLEHGKVKRDEIIKYYLPKNSRYMIEICDDAESNNLSQNHTSSE